MGSVPEREGVLAREELRRGRPREWRGDGAAARTTDNLSDDPKFGF
jgi:hypothetical protein